MGGMVPAGQFRVAADHPSLPGHFPGRPIVPGVVLLDEVGALLLALAPGHRIAGWPRVKFTTPVRPGQVVNVHASVDGPRASFTGDVEGRSVLAGTAQLAALTAAA